MSDSLFTKIINGQIPCYKIYEDDKTFVFLDIYPTQPGHTLVIPKVQVEFLWDLNDEDYVAVMATTKKIARHLRNKLTARYVGVKVIGVDVPHAHVHLIPFSDGPEFYTEREQFGEPDKQALTAMAKTLAF